MQVQQQAPTPTNYTSARLTSWTKEPSLQDLKNDLEQAKPTHDAQMAKIRRWTDLLAVRGKEAPPRVKGRSSVQPKLIRRQAEWRYSALTEPLLSNEKLFSVKPSTFEDGPAAKQNELVLNWQFRTKLNKVKFVDDLVRATVDEGTCILRLGWKRHTVKVKEPAPVYSYFAIQSEEALNTFKQALEAKQADIRTFEESAPPELVEAVNYYEETGEATVAQVTGSELVEVEKVLENRPTVEVMNPNNVVIDPSCGGDISKAMFVCVSFETSKADMLKEGKRYKNLDQINWAEAAPISDPDHATGTPDNFQFKDEARRKVVAYEYWGYFDIEGNGKLTAIVATWIGSTMIRLEESPFVGGKLPFVIIPYLPIKRETYGEPDAELLEDNQKILGAVTRGMIDVLGRSANGQQGFAKGMLDPLNRRRYENGQDYEFNPGMSPTQGLIEHKYPELPQSALLMLNLQNQEAEALTGVKSFSGGISGEAYGDVAAGIRGMLDAAAKREMAILRRIATGLAEVGLQIINMNKVFMSEEETIQVTNETFVKVRRDELQGENFDLKVDISTTEIDNAKAQDLGFMLQTLGPNMETEIRMMILAEIAELKRMPTLANKLRNYKPQPSPEAQELAQLELQAKRKEIEKLDSEIMLNQAKAEEARANRDKKIQDNLDEATGVKHERNMSLQKAQSQGNQNLQITKALTAPRKEGESAPDIEAALGFTQLSDKLSDVGNGFGSMVQRDLLAESNPAYSLGSSKFDPNLDPALRPQMQL